MTPSVVMALYSNAENALVSGGRERLEPLRIAAGHGLHGLPARIPSIPFCKDRWRDLQSYTGAAKRP